jgi:hypothetical protein
MAPEPPWFVVARGDIEYLTAGVAGLPTSQFHHQLTSQLVVCDTEAGTFKIKVKCRKWTDLSGNPANTPCLVAPPGPPQPPWGCVVSVGEMILKIVGPPTRTIVCRDFTLEGTQTYSTEAPFVVFLFTGYGEADGASVTGAGRCLQKMDPFGAPTPVSWRFVLTVC